MNDPRVIDTPRRYVRHLDADEIARLLDGVDHTEPEVVRRMREFRPGTIADDFRDFIDDVRRDPVLAVVCVGLGLVAGMGATVGLALVIGAFL